MTHPTLERLRRDLDEWRARLEHLRVQTNLGEKEARDRLRALEDRLQPAVDRAVERLGTLVATGSDEVRTLARSLESGWAELRRTHRELTREMSRKP